MTVSETGGFYWGEKQMPQFLFFCFCGRKEEDEPSLLGIAPSSFDQIVAGHFVPVASQCKRASIYTWVHFAWLSGLFFLPANGFCLWVLVVGVLYTLSPTNMAPDRGFFERKLIFHVPCHLVLYTSFWWFLAEWAVSL